LATWPFFIAWNRSHEVFHENKLPYTSDAYDVDETGVSPNHTPPSIVAPTDIKVQSVTTGKSDTTTIIGSGSASGTCIPPYFVLKGKRWISELLNEGTPGVSDIVSDSWCEWYSI
jgi:hypothetical protein